MMAENLEGLRDAARLPGAMRDQIDRLVDEYRRHQPHNRLVRSYYEGTVTVQDGNLELSSDMLVNDQACYWPEKAVDALADRERFDGFSAPEGVQDVIAAIARENNLVAAVNRYEPSKLLHGCMFATVGRGERGPLVRLHSAETATAIPDGDNDEGFVSSGLAIAATGRTPWSPRLPVATLVNAYLPGSVVSFERTGRATWRANVQRVPERRPMMYALAHLASGTQPLGKTRVTGFVRALTRDAVRVLFRMEVLSAFYTMPQRALLGLTDEQFDLLMTQKQRMYLDSVILSTRDPQTGQSPTYTQLPSNSPQPFIDQLRILAAQFSGATGVPMSSLGVLTDNPTSAEAMAASREDICLVAERDIAADRAVLATVARMALAVNENTTTDRLTDAQRAVSAMFMPAMLGSAAAEADRAAKLAAADPAFAGTDVYYEMQGFDAETRARIQDQKQRQANAAAVSAIFGE